MEKNLKNQIAQFLGSEEILLVDRNASSANRIQRILIELGAKRPKVSLHRSIEESLETFSAKKPRLLISDYSIIGGTGFDLFRKLRQLPEGEKSIFVMLTSNQAQSIVAQAAEEDIDSYILRPFTVDSVSEILCQTISQRLFPSVYSSLIEEGKAAIASLDFDRAREILHKAQKSHNSPTLAVFYEAQIDILLADNSAAVDLLMEGLSFNEYHFKCLWGLFLLLKEEKKFSEAYSVLKKISTIFPVNDDRLRKLVRLAIRTKNTADIYDHYKIYTELEDRTPELTRHVCAGLCIAGKVHLKNGDFAEASRCLEAIGISGSECEDILREAVSLSVNAGANDLARKLLLRFNSTDSSDYLIARFMVDSIEDGNPAVLVKKGLDLYNRNIRSEKMLWTLVNAMEELGLSQEKIKPFIREAESA